VIATILTIGIPTFTVLVGIFLNRSDYNRLDARLTSEIGGLRTALQSEIAATRKQAHDDIMILIGISREHETRITRLESR
jgi:hypothetical protein